VLRQAAVRVEVFAPLMIGVQGTTREPRPKAFGLLLARANHVAATSNWSWVRRLRDGIASRRLSDITAQHHAVLAGFRSRLEHNRPDVVMVSTYLMYRPLCVDICALCRDAGIPVLIGGPYFSQPQVNAQWLDIPGLTGLVTGEVELELAAIVRTLAEGGDVSRHDGVQARAVDGPPRGTVAPPLKALDAVPFPDFSDFPWHAYPNRIVPVITGRGCGWGVCSFCSDVTSSAGRSFRSRSPGAVLAELRQQHERHQASRFVFTDLKLNSDVGMWRALAGDMQTAVPGAQWIAAVHVGPEVDNGLSPVDLRAAAASGCVRLSTGLESGSQRMLDLMKKGTRLDDVSAYLQGAASAGISVRCTMVLGHPGETADDVHASADFLARHRREIERVSLNRLQLTAGTALDQAIRRSPSRFKGLKITSEADSMAQLGHSHAVLASASHRRAVMRLLREIHHINSRGLCDRAREFDGVM
jgi:radical SAM superfamily enzyme YgiQ (UPF0313 family)